MLFYIFSKKEKISWETKVVVGKKIRKKTRKRLKIPYWRSGRSRKKRKRTNRQSRN